MARFRGGVLLALAGLFIGCVSVAEVAHAAASATFYATPGGSASAGCSQVSPCSLSGAQVQGRSFLKSSPGADVTVLVGDGTYPLSSGLGFGAADSGGSGQPAVWKAGRGAPTAGTGLSGGPRRGDQAVWNLRDPRRFCRRQLNTDCARGAAPNSLGRPSAYTAARPLERAPWELLVAGRGD